MLTLRLKFDKAKGRVPKLRVSGVARETPVRQEQLCTAPSDSPEFLRQLRLQFAPQ